MSSAGYREQAVSDYGVDAQVEVIENNEPTGRLIGLQIKTGSSYRPRGDDFVFYGELRHLENWARHSLPAFLVLHDPDKNLTLWQKVERRLVNVPRADGQSWCRAETSSMPQPRHSSQTPSSTTISRSAARWQAGQLYTLPNL